MTDAVTQAKFAELMCVNRSTVHRWGKDGRLVMQGDKVLVEASKQRIKETEANRSDVAARHAAAKGQQAEQPPTPGQEKRVDAQARKEAAQADIAEMERDKLAGKLIERTEVEAVIVDVFLTFRQELENRRHRLADSLANQQRDTVIAVLKEEDYKLLSDAERDFATQIQELTQGDIA